MCPLIAMAVQTLIVPRKVSAGAAQPRSARRRGRGGCGGDGTAVRVATFRDGKIVKEQNLGDTAMFERVYGTK